MNAWHCLRIECRQKSELLRWVLGYSTFLGFVKKVRRSDQWGRRRIKRQVSQIWVLGGTRLQMMKFLTKECLISCVKYAWQLHNMRTETWLLVKWMFWLSWQEVLKRNEENPNTDQRGCKIFTLCFVYVPNTHKEYKPFVINMS